MAEQFDDGEQYENAPATLESLVQYEDPVRRMRGSPWLWLFRFASAHTLHQIVHI